MGLEIKKTGKTIEAALAWWGAELAAMVPPRLRDVFLPDETTAHFFFAAHQTEITSPADEGVDKKIFDVPFPDVLDDGAFATFLSEGGAHPVTVHLAEELFLTRQMSLPKAAKKNYGNIVRLQLPRLLPMAEQDIHYDCAAREQEGEETITVSVFMIARARAAEIVSRLTAAGRRVKAIKGRLGADGHESMTFLNLGKENKERENRLVTGLVAGGLFFSLLFTTLHYGQLSAREAFLSTEAARLKDRARVIQQLSDEVQRFDQQQDLYQSKIDHRRLDEILSALTAILPDDSWVFDFARNGDRLTLTGKTSNASLLVQKIDDSPLFGKVTNSSTRIDGQAGQGARERFSLSFELEERGGE